MVIGIDASRANQREKTGTEWYSWHLIRAMWSLLPDHQLRLYVREPLCPDWGTLPSNVSIHVLSWPPGLLWSHLRLGWELLWHPPTILFVPADTVPLIRRSRTYTTIHDVAFERMPELYARRSVQRRMGWGRPFVHGLVRLMTLGQYGATELDYHRWSVRHALRVSRKILTVSEFTKNELINILKANPTQIIVTYQGVQQPNAFAYISQASRNRVLDEFKLQRPFFLFVGRLERKKNIQALLEGYQHYCRQIQDQEKMDLVLVGSPGNGWEEAVEVLKAPELQGRVHQLGWVPADQLRILQTAAQAFIFLSAYEGFGVPPLESFSAGVPVIASRNGSIPEILGPAGLYVDPKDIPAIALALTKISQDPKLANQLVELGKKRVREFTWEKTAVRTVQAILADLPNTL